MSKDFQCSASSGRLILGQCDRLRCKSAGSLVRGADEILAAGVLGTQVSHEVTDDHVESRLIDRGSCLIALGHPRAIRCRQRVLLASLVPLPQGSDQRIFECCCRLQCVVVDPGLYFARQVVGKVKMCAERIGRDLSIDRFDGFLKRIDCRVIAINRSDHRLTGDDGLVESRQT